jgi:hypothetical protein
VVRLPVPRRRGSPRSRSASMAVRSQMGGPASPDHKSHKAYRAGVVLDQLLESQLWMNPLLGRLRPLGQFFYVRLGWLPLGIGAEVEQEGHLDRGDSRETRGEAARLPTTSELRGWSPEACCSDGNEGASRCFYRDLQGGEIESVIGRHISSASQSWPELLLDRKSNSAASVSSNNEAILKTRQLKQGRVTPPTASSRWIGLDEAQGTRLASGSCRMRCRSRGLREDLADQG